MHHRLRKYIDTLQLHKYKAEREGEMWMINRHLYIMYIYGSHGTENNAFLVLSFYTTNDNLLFL